MPDAHSFPNSQFTNIAILNSEHLGKLISGIHFLDPCLSSHLGHLQLINRFFLKKRIKNSSYVLVPTLHQTLVVQGLADMNSCLYLVDESPANRMGCCGEKKGQEGVHRGYGVRCTDERVKNNLYHILRSSGEKGSVAEWAPSRSWPLAQEQPMCPTFELEFCPPPQGNNIKNAAQTLLKSYF